MNLITISEINETARNVVARSHRVYMIALNAMLMSKKTLSSGGGFGSVTTQLRDFSNKLDSQIQTLKTHVSSLAYGTASLHKLKRYEKLIAKLKGVQGFELIHKRVNKEQTVLAEQNNYLIHVLTSDLERLLLQIGIGSNLAVLAKVEANETGALSESLCAISEEMSATIEEIEQLVTLSKNRLRAA